MAQIHYLTGDIFQTGDDAIVNPVNCVGVMGKGLALQFKQRYPDNFTMYEEACKQNQVHLGKLCVQHRETAPFYIVNFPTKLHWKDDSRVEDVECGLIALKYWIGDKKIKSISIPPLGCGLGGLKREQVYPLITQHLKDIPHLVVHVVSID